MRTRLERHDEQDGVISVMAAVMALAVLMAAGLAVDVGRVAYVSRDQQGVTDRAALDAVDVLTTVPSGTSLGTVQAAVEQEVDASLARNPGSTGTARNRLVKQVQLGNVGADRRFTLPACSACTVDDVSAVRVETTSEVPFLFAVGATDDDPGLVPINARRVAKSAVAEQSEIASITVGSRLVSLDGGLVNDTLSALVCQNIADPTAGACNVSVDLLTYEGLTGTTVGFGSLLDELALSAGTVDDVATTQVSARGLLEAAATVLGRDGKVAEAALLNTVATQMDGSVQVALGKLLEVTTTNGQAAADSAVNVFGLLTGSLQVANGTNAVNLDGLTLSAPGLLGLTGSLTAVEAPVSAIGPARQRPDGSWVTSAHTSQVNLDTAVVIEAGTLDGVLASVGSLLPLLTLGTPTISDITLPITATVADARADLTDIVCGPGGPGSAPDVTVAVTTGVGSITIPHEHVVDIDVPIKVALPLLGLVNAGTLQIQVKGSDTTTQLGASGPQQVTFNTGAYPRGPQRVTGPGVGLGEIAGVMELEINVNIKPAGGLSAAVQLANSLLTPAVKFAIQDVVEAAVQATVAAPLDAALDPVLQTLGIQVGAADVWANSADCARRQLAATTP